METVKYTIMVVSEIMQIEGVGPITFVRSPSARRVVITIRPRRGVRVSLPSGTNIEDAMDFVKRKTPWIKKHLSIIAEHQRQQEAVNQAFRDIDKKEARKKITKRFNELAKEHGFNYGRISLRNQRTRWGSCSANKNISLNYKLVLLPEELMDYVILHELVHTRYHDHSDAFWEELDRYVGDAKKIAKTLTDYGLGIL